MSTAHIAMKPHELVVADISRDVDRLIELNVEYLAWVFAEVDKAFGVQLEKMIGMPVEAYVPSMIATVCGKQPPDGIFYLVRVDGKLAGMGGLRGLNTRQAEIKRIYIRPEFRGRSLGNHLLEHLLSDARLFGYEQACLDSGPFQKAAQRIYEKAGFVDRLPYEGVEVPPELHAGWRFMERAL